jgi:hypothetical protein
MEFPGFLGIGLWRLRQQIQNAPIGALGPFFGVISADMTVDIMRGRYGSVLFDIVLAPLIAIAILNVAQRDSAGPTTPMMFLLGTISAMGAATLIARGLTVGSGYVFMMGLRHLTVGAYVWASIASEPPVRRRYEFSTVGT